MLSVADGECHKQNVHAECHYVECRYAGCCGALINAALKGKFNLRKLASRNLDCQTFYTSN